MPHTCSEVEIYSKVASSSKMEKLKMTIKYNRVNVLCYIQPPAVCSLLTSCIQTKFTFTYTECF